MPPRSEDMDIWRKKTNPLLIDIFATIKKEYFDGLGDIVGGDEVQGFCNSTFGWRDGQTVVSTHGIALILPSKLEPKFIVGVSVKDFYHPKPLTLYRLILRPNIQEWKNRFDYKTADFGSQEWYDLSDTLKDIVIGLRDITKDLRFAQSSNKDSCAPKAAMLLLLISTLSVAIIKSLIP